MYFKYCKEYAKMLNFKLNIVKRQYIQKIKISYGL